MKISIDARGINLYHGTGIGTYTENLVKELLTIDNENEYSLFWTGKNYEEYKRHNCNIIFASSKHGSFYENFYFPNFLKDNSIDLFHLPQNGIGFNENYSTDCVVTIHDLIPYVLPETTGRGYLERFLKNMPTIIDKSKGILTVSEYSKRDILKFFNHISEDKIFVTPLAAKSNYKPLNKDNCRALVQKRFNFSLPYILYIGGFSSRKNAKDLILSFDKVYKDLKTPHILLLAGSLKDEGKKLLELSKSLSSSNKIIFTSFIEDEFMPILYNGSEAFVYPSFYEGFGLPPLEAMSCMVPVITSNLTSIPEVTGNTCILINPYNSFELETSLIHLLNNTELKEKLAKAGYERSLEFSWKNTAIKTLAAYKRISNL
ncbi:MAG: glycosyltransferase family 4 protein [Clostridium sp.]|nr:glycosyltransferase family 4 protein [Clostridium sp.]